jgi:hypothetical protein
MAKVLRRPAIASAVLFILWRCAPALLAGPPQAAAPASVRTWIGHEPQIEQQLKTAEVVRLEDLGTGVTHPRRAHLEPADPVESATWKVLPPGKLHGYWESYKSEIAAYELDKLLDMHVVPPAVERRVGDEVGAAIMWVEGTRSVKEQGGKVPTGSIWGKAIRRMLMFDNLVANPDRNAGNILLGQPGEFVLIDHSRAFLTSSKLPEKVERVDAELWDRMKMLTHDDLLRALKPWLEDDAIDAIVQRRDRMAKEVDKLVAKKGRDLVIIP